MRILAVSPGAVYSTTDVYDGLVAGFTALGHEVCQFDSSRHIYVADQELRFWLRKAKDKVPPKRPRPGDGGLYAEFAEAVRFSAFAEVLVEARRQAVDLVVIVSGYLISGEVLSMLSRRPDTPHKDGIAPTVMVFTESPYEEARQLRQAHLVDGVFVNDRKSVPLYAQATPYAWYLPMGYHPTRHLRLPGEPDYAHDVVFVGVGYRERIEMLEAIDWTGVNLGLYGDWRFVGKRSPLRRFVHQGIISNQQATDLYRKSRVGINLHRSCVDYWGDGGGEVHGESLNPRAYELAACGVPQVTQARKEWYDVFGSCGINTAFVTAGEMERSVRELLGSDDLRARVADSQHRAVQGHSYTDRAARIVDCITGG